MRRVVRIAVLALWAALLSENGLARTILAEGIAPIELGGPEKLRQAAYDDALKAAGLKEGASFALQTYMAINGNTVESSQLRPKAEVGDIKIIREWTDAHFFHMMIQGQTVNRCSGQISGMQGYKKKVVVTRFDIPNVTNVSDMPDIWGGLPLALHTRFKATQKYLPEVVTSTYPLMNERDPDRVESDRHRLTALAYQKDAQIILAGRVLDTSVAAGQLFWQDDKRHFEVEVRVIDGLTGTEIATHRESATARGLIDMTGIPFGSSRFLSSDYGQAATRVLDALFGDVEDDLECLPFSSRIRRVEGQRIYFNAGTTSGVHPGDTLALYLRDKTFSYQGGSGSRVSGLPERPSGSVRVLSVQPQFAIAEILEDAAPIVAHEGDIVRLELHP